VAGQAGAPVEPVETPPVVEEVAQQPPVVEEVAQPPVVDEVAQQPSRNLRDGDGSGSSPGSPGFETGAERPPQPAVRGLSALFDSRRATTVLLSLVAVLALAAGGLLAWDATQDDATAKPSTQPVVISGDDANAGVDAAAKAAEKILTRTYQDYDQQVDEAAALMTPSFAKEFRRTAGDVERDFVAAKTDQQARVVAQGVEHATRTEVQALVFLNYYVSKDGGDTTYTAYRALVTVVHTDRGWLVSAIDTK
jgi:Mce-associated membrane protein